MNNDIKNKIANLRDLQEKLNALRTPGFTDVPLGAGGVKGFIKRFVRKNVMWMLAPYEAQLNARISMERYIIDEMANILTALEASLRDTSDLAEKTALKQAYDEFDEISYRNKTGEAISETVREVMAHKWKMIDAEAIAKESGEDVLTCAICTASHKRKEYETMVTKCRFGGGELVRYVCPDCGNVFGPTKFSSLTDEEKGADYTLHYFGYDEGNATYKEIEAFNLLKPEKDKVYLNYGCGCWNSTIKILREQGYNVYGYEPYAADAGNPYIITSKEELCRMKFDGIFSNDLVEHLFDPVSDFKFMRTLLRDADSKMSHSTACFAYKYEYTRFHMNFPLGDSAKILAERSGFELAERYDEMDTNDLICCVFTIADKENFKKQYGDDGKEILDKLFFREDRLTGKSSVELNYGEYTYGPYMTCAAMKYRLNVRVVTMASVAIKITSMKGLHTLYEGRLKYGDNLVEFECDKTNHDVEFIITNDSDKPATITGIELI